MCSLAPSPRRFPLGKWAMILIAVPTFYLPVAYFMVAIWGAFLGGPGNAPPVIRGFVAPALPVTFVLLPVYVLWVALSRRLNWKEKVYWLFVVVFLNMVGMPVFYVFIARRYLGMDDRPSARDERAATALLTSCGISRSAVSTQQWQVLMRYCRQVRRYRQFAVLWLVILVPGLYLAAWHIPSICVATFSGSVPTDTVVVDRIHGIIGTSAVPRYVHEQFVMTVMYAGAAAGVIGSSCLFIWASISANAWASFHRKAFLAFVKGNGGD